MSAALLLADATAAGSAAGKSPVGFLDPLLYSGVGAAEYTGIVPQRYGSGSKTFAGPQVGVSGPVGNWSPTKGMRPRRPAWIREPASR